MAWWEKTNRGGMNEESVRRLLDAARNSARDMYLLSQAVRDKGFNDVATTLAARSGRTLEVVAEIEKELNTNGRAE